MKRTFFILTAIVISAMLVLSISAAYPASPDWKWPLPATGELISGELFGTEPWGDNTANTFDKAWDGDETTFFDPLNTADVNCYTAVKAAQAYVLTEIRIMPRSDQLPRFNGATIQGSNDGENWTDIFASYIDAEMQDFYCFTPTSLGDAGEWYDSTTAYTMFRYVNTVTHGDVAEIELYGVAAAPAVETEAPVVETAAPETEAPAPVETEAPAAAPQTADTALISAVILIAAAGMTIVFKKH